MEPHRTVLYHDVSIFLYFASIPKDIVFQSLRVAVTLLQLRDIFYPMVCDEAPLKRLPVPREVDVAVVALRSEISEVIGKFC